MSKIIIILSILSLLISSSCDITELPTPLPEYNSIDEAPAWGPDGKWIAYQHFNSNGNDSIYPTGLYIIEPNGTNRKLIITGNIYNPDWSPDGNEIVFRYDEIYSIKIDGTDLRQITQVGQAYFPSWSPDGSRIAFDTGYNDSTGAKGIWTIDNIGLNLTRISRHSRMPNWSPKGEYLVHTRSLTTAEPEIYIMDSTGENFMRLTFNEVFDLYPKWSYDGKEITWTSGNEQNEIWIMNSDGTNQYYLTEGYYPCWSPDNKKIVYSKRIHDKIALFIIDIDTREIKQLSF